VGSVDRRRDGYAIRSMAQTRALSGALQAPLRHIAVLAGYEGTSAEEMISADERERPKPNAPDESKATSLQKQKIKALLRDLDLVDPATDWRALRRDQRRRL
jgi:hypothetical protein